MMSKSLLKDKANSSIDQISTDGEGDTCNLCCVQDTLQTINNPAAKGCDVMCSSHVRKKEFHATSVCNTTKTAGSYTNVPTSNNSVTSNNQASSAKSKTSGYVLPIVSKQTAGQNMTVKLQKQKNVSLEKPEMTGTAIEKTSTITHLRSQDLKQITNVNDGIPEGEFCTGSETVGVETDSSTCTHMPISKIQTVKKANKIQTVKKANAGIDHLKNKKVDIVVKHHKEVVDGKVPLARTKYENAVNEITKGHIKGIVVTIKEHYGFIAPSQTLPKQFESNKNVYYLLKNVEGPSVDINDEVQFMLDRNSRKKPSACSVKLLTKAGEIKDQQTIGSPIVNKAQPFLRGKLKNCLTNEHGDYGFLQVDCLPEGYAKKDVIVYFDRVVSAGLVLIPGDILEFKIGLLQKDKYFPKALTAKLVSCRNRSMKTVEAYIDEVQETVSETWLKYGCSKDLFDLMSCHAVWKLLCNSHELPIECVSKIIYILSALEELTKDRFEQHYGDLLDDISQTAFFIPKKGLFEKYVKCIKKENTSDIKKVMDFMATLVKHIPRKSRAVVRIVAPLVSQCESSMERLVFNILRETAKSTNADVEDLVWNELPLVPSSKELLSGQTLKQLKMEQSLLSPVKVTGPYDSIDDYMDTYFRLLRADCFSALISGISDFMHGRLDCRDMNVYKEAKFAGIQVTKSESGLAVALQFKPYRQVRNWFTSSNMMFGNLLCISPTGTFTDIIWATVYFRDAKLLQERQIILIELCSDCNSVTVSAAVLRLEQCSGNIVMAESPTYYRAYQPVMKAFQSMNHTTFPFIEELVQVEKTPIAPFFERSLDGDDKDIRQTSIVDPLKLQRCLPVHKQSLNYKKTMEELVQKRETSVAPVDNLTKVDGNGETIGKPYAHPSNGNGESICQPFVDPSIIYPKFKQRTTNTGLDNEVHALSDSHAEHIPIDSFLDLVNGVHETSLDKSQEIAVAQSLTRRIAIIQGPPGTGKTFIGVKIVRLILSMIPKLSSPILVLTYKNHALDEFLKQIVHHYPDGVARVGGRSNDPEISRLNVRNLELRTSIGPMMDVLKKCSLLKPQLEEAAKKLHSARHFSVECFMAQASHIQIERFLKMCPWPQNRRPLIQSLLERTKRSRISLQGIFNIAENNVEFIDPNLINEIKSMLSEALSAWCPRINVFDDIQKRYESTITVPDFEEPATETRSPDELLDEQDLKGQENERYAATQTAPQNLKDIILFESLTVATGVPKIVLLSCMRDALAKINSTALLNHQHLWKMSDMEKALLIQIFLYKHVEHAGECMEEQLREYSKLCVERNELDTFNKVKLLKKKQVIGMTITGASINRPLLAQIKSEVIIVEEAAEILEPQLLAALNGSTRQLVMIGDHQQLRPPVESYTLTKQFHFDVSLMERLIKNDFPHDVLKKQNRMRPEFAELLEDIYPYLQSNLENVDKNKQPPCMVNSMFFWHHENPELGGRTYTNELEADRVVQLTLFMLQQSYNPEEITILGAYQGQVALIRTKMKAAESRFPHLFPTSLTMNGEKQTLKVKVHTIDMYQGDENEVVIVSLVRSNNTKTIGFLKTMNRRCVAQSRAKCGMYFVGDTETLSSAHVWNIFIGKMRKQGLVGCTIKLQCPRHQVLSQVAVTTAEDVPLGSFCAFACGSKMSCGKHMCKKSCQPAHKHNVCKQDVLFEHSSCGHIDVRQCCDEENNIHCMSEVKVKLPKCGHEAHVPCHIMKNDEVDSFICKEPCERTLPCSHPCQSNCGSLCMRSECAPCIKIRQAEKELKDKIQKEKNKQVLMEADEQIQKMKDSAFWREELKPNGDTASIYWEIYDKVDKYIHTVHNWRPNIRKIEQITNSKLEKKWYESKKRMFDPSRNELKFHGTKAESANKIVQEGFRLPKTPGMFGAGIYLATDSSKSAQRKYTSQSGMLLVCDALIGRSKTVTKGNQQLTGKKLTDMGYDSVFAERNSKQSGGVMFDEYVIFKPERVLLRYIVHYEDLNGGSASLDKFTATSLERNAVGSTKKYHLTPSREVNIERAEDIHYRIVESQFHRLYKHNLSGFTIESVDYYVNPNLIKRFNQKQQEFKSNYGDTAEAGYILAFHGTDSQNITSIVENNFQMDMVKRAAYGHGIYLSEFPNVSLDYGRGLLLCRVLPGRTHQGQKEPGYDSNTVRADSEGRGWATVVYNPDQILPCYVINLK